MITKEEFLENCEEDELFSLLHEFMMRFNERRKKDFNFFCQTFELEITDWNLGEFCKEMIKDCKNSIYL